MNSENRLTYSNPFRSGLDRLASVIVMSQPTGHRSLVEEPHAEENLEEIVEYEDFSKLEGFSVFHEFWTENLEENFCQDFSENFLLNFFSP